MSRVEITDNTTNSFTGGSIFNAGTLNVEVSTFANNKADQNNACNSPCKDVGGAIYGYQSSNTTIKNATIAYNISEIGGGLGNAYPNSFSLTNTIVAFNGPSINSGQNCNGGTSYPSDNGHNLQYPAGTIPTCGPSIPSTSDPKLGTLAFNGGSTRTIALQAGSPAIDTGDDTICTAAVGGNKDQRTYPRPNGVHCDIGAYEVPSGVTLKVTSSADDESGCNYLNSTTLGCTLRGAIALASTDNQPTYISFDPALAGNTILLTRAIQVNVNSNPVLQGNFGQKAVTISGQGKSRIFEFTHDTQMTIQNFNLVDGNAGALPDENGGAINVSANNVSITTYNTTFARNKAYSGGAIYNNGGGSPSVSIIDSTFVNNTAVNSGGAITVGNTYFYITSSTFADNDASNSGRTIQGTVDTLRDTIIDNRAPYTINNCSNLARNVVKNLEVQFNTCGSAYISDPLLERKSTGEVALQYNGGTSNTVRVRTGSLALDHGDTATCPSTDQRGISRYNGCDIGATEKLPPRKIPSGPDTIGLWNAGTFYLRNSNTTGPADITTYFNPYGSNFIKPITGDWNGDGVDTIGIYDTNVGVFLLSNNNVTPSQDYAFTYGNPGDIPLSGCWDESMLDPVTLMCKDGVGIYRPSNGLGFFLHHDAGNGLGFADYYTSTVAFTGPNSDTPITGDWDGDGFDSVGLYHYSNSVFYLSDSILNDNFTPNYAFTYAGPGALVFAGDWTGVGTIPPIRVGYTYGGGVYLRNNLSNGGPDIAFVYGGSGWTPFAGRWNVRAPRSGMSLAAPNVIVPRATPQPPNEDPNKFD